MRRLPLILASASPRRRRLMAGLRWPVRVRPSRVREPKPRGRVAPGPWAVRLSLLKAREVAGRFKEGLVLGADTVVYRAGRIYGKPASAADARRILSELSGRWHTVYTGLALAAPGGRTWTAVAATRVKMRRFTAAELDRLSRRNHDKAGAYAAQDRRGGYVDGMKGDFDNVVGLPRRAVRRLIAQARRAGFAAR